MHQINRFFHDGDLLPFKDGIIIAQGRSGPVKRTLQ